MYGIDKINKARISPIPIPIPMFALSIPMFYWDKNASGDMSCDIKKVLALGYSRVYDEEMDYWYNEQRIVDEDGYIYEGDYNDPCPAFRYIVIQGSKFQEMVSYVIKWDKKEEEEARHEMVKILHELGCPVYSRGEDGKLRLMENWKLSNY